MPFVRFIYGSLGNRMTSSAARRVLRLSGVST
nr:MAG TPA: hypothetical protein [Bacteriophage sp.]